MRADFIHQVVLIRTFPFIAEPSPKRLRYWLLPPMFPTTTIEALLLTKPFEMTSLKSKKLSLKSSTACYNDLPHLQVALG
jgi:hypothetical protein